MIRPELGESQTFLEMDEWGRLLWLNMISLVDDAGILPGNFPILSGNLLSGLKVKNEIIEENLKHLEERKAVYRYEVDGSKYIILLNFFTYQALNNPSPSKRPLPLQEDYNNCIIQLQYWYDNYKLKVLDHPRNINVNVSSKLN